MEFQFPTELVVRISALDEDRTLDLSQVDAELVVNLALHGLKQLLNDATSGLKDDLPKARERVDAVWKKVQEGEWTPGSGGGRRLDPIEAILRDLAYENWRKLGVKGKVVAELVKKGPELAMMASIVAAQASERKPDSKEWLQKMFDLGERNLTDENRAKLHDKARQVIEARKADSGIKVEV